MATPTGQALVSYYDSPKGLVVIVSSHPHEDAISIEIDLGPYAEKVQPTGKNVLEREGAYELEDGMLKLDLDSHDFRMIVFDWRD